MRYCICLFILWIPMALWGQTESPESIEQLREKGYQAKHNKQYSQALQYYKNILDQRPEDYDARLAVAKLYYLNNNCDSATVYFRRIYTNDSTDVEALNGLGKCRLRNGHTRQAISYFKKGVDYLPDHVPQYLKLAKAYSWQGELDKAIKVYQKASKIDDSYAKVWAGIGKMYYWKGQPQSAKSYYQKALALDSTNQKIRKKYQQILKALDYQVSGQLKMLQEKEETYEINALVQEYKLNKRFGDHFDLALNFLLDRSERNFTTKNRNDTTRWYDNTYLKAKYILPNHRFSGYIGASKSDGLLTTYGLSWKAHLSLGQFTVKNTLTAGYNYFYYWNQVGRRSIKDQLKIEYHRFTLSTHYRTGFVDAKPIRKYPSDAYTTNTNPFDSYQLALSYQLFKKPKIEMGGHYSFLNYEYKSPDYYTPYNRNLAGPTISLYNSFGAVYVYGNFSYNWGTESNYSTTDNSTPGIGKRPNNNPSEANITEETINVDNWSTSLELGYSGDNLSLSIGGSRFYNPYYEHLAAYISIKGYF